MAPAASPEPVAPPTTPAGPAAASHVAERGTDRASATHTDSAQRRSMTKTGALNSSSKAAAPSSTLHKSAINSPTAPTNLSAPAPAPSKPTPTASKKATPTASKKPPTTTTAVSQPDQPSAPVTVHPAPSNRTSTTPMRRPGRKPQPPNADDHPGTHDPSSPHYNDTTAAPPDPALFTFPSLLSSLGAEASDPLHAIAEICGRSRMSLADEHGSHLPPATSLLQHDEEEEEGAGQQQQQQQRRNQGKDGRGGAVAEVAVQRVDVRGRRSSAPLEGETHAQAGGGYGGKGWMEGVMAWLWGGAGVGEGGATAREKRKAVRDLRRVLEEREGGTAQA